MIPEKVGNFSGILIVFLINPLMLTKSTPYFIIKNLFLS